MARPIVLTDPRYTARKPGEQLSWFDRAAMRVIRRDFLGT